ncbi:conserved exported hypothetical protein [Vibrio nigripulchritudo SFn118]|nr:conserved exported hypothetical protein [Vibrio nigripulchritudo SFn118]
MSTVYARRSGDKRAYPVAAAVILVASAPVFLSAGLAVPFAAADGNSKFAGIATFDTDNSRGLAGERKAEVEHQEFALLNNGDILYTHIGATVYFTSDTAVSVSSATNSRPIAGVVTELDDDIVWVQPAVA